MHGSRSRQGRGICGGRDRDRGQRQPLPRQGTDELDWTNAQRQKRAVAEYLAALEAEAQADEEGGAAAAVPTERPASRRMSFWRSLGTLP
jgi:hypothetical protein